MNHSFRSQQTIAESAHVEGFGYWSGQDVRVEFRPAEPDTGIVFVRHDLPTPRRIPASLSHRIEVPRRTNLVANGATVEMVEHALAALSGLRIDNCEVWVDRPEMPGCDGSSMPFVAALQRAGIVAQNVPRPQLVVSDVTRVGNDEAWVEARPAESEGTLSLRYRLDYSEHPAIGRQTVSLDVTPETFVEQLASSRTFILQHEAAWLQQQGLGQRVTSQDLLVFDDEGPLDNELRWEDECGRHKTLDLVGDLALAGCDLVARVVAHRSGHRLNAELVQVLLSEGHVLQGWRRSA